MPFDALTQFEGQQLAFIAPSPALGKIGDDRVEAVLRNVLVVDYEVMKMLIIGITVEMVASSWIDMLAGLSPVIGVQDAAGFLRRGGYRRPAAGR